MAIEGFRHESQTALVVPSGAETAVAGASADGLEEEQPMVRLQVYWARCRCHSSSASRHENAPRLASVRSQVCSRYPTRAIGLRLLSPDRRSRVTTTLVVSNNATETAAAACSK